MPVLQRARVENTPLWFQLVEDDREDLEYWMPYLKYIRTPEEADLHVTGNHVMDFYQGERVYEIWDDQGNVAGLISLHTAKKSVQSVEIGYWIAKSFRGQGIVTNVCQYLISYTFIRFSEINQIILKCAHENVPSQAVAKRLKFQLAFNTSVNAFFYMSRDRWEKDFFDKEHLGWILD